MVSLNVDYTNNQMTIDFDKTKQNALNNVQTYFKDMIRDLNASLSKEIKDDNFNTGVVDDIIFSLRHASDKMEELTENISECTSVSSLVEFLNDEFEDDALVFYMLFDTPTSIKE